MPSPDDTVTTRTSQSADIRTSPTSLGSSTRRAGASQNLVSVLGSSTDVQHEDGHNQNDEKTPLLGGGGGEGGGGGADGKKSSELQVYARRWYVLLLFCLCQFMQGLGWSTWGPVTQSLIWGFDFSNSSIALLGVLGNAGYILFAFPVSIMMEKTGNTSLCVHN